MGTTDPEVFSQHLNLDGYEELSLDGMVEVLDNNLQRTINILAPIKSRTVLIRATNPWFSNEIRDQKRKMRKQREKVEEIQNGIL